jgi:hypothetical protein
MNLLRRVGLFVWIAAWLAASASPSPAQPCVGDCDASGRVAVGEAVVCIQISLGRASLDDCLGADGGDGRVGIDDLVRTVQNSVQGCPASRATATPTPSPTPSPSPTAPAVEVPTELAALEAWLQAGNYLAWPAEPEIHPANGQSAHPSSVRVFVNDALLASLEDGLAAHPAGAASVKEIYDQDESFRGWAVMVKLDADSDGGQGWYWYERVDSFLFANGRGARICTPCHSQGSDYFRSPFPFP